MDLKVSNIDVIVLNGGGRHTDTGHRSHYPVFTDEKGTEYISLDGHTFVLLANQNLNIVRREEVRR